MTLSTPLAPKARALTATAIRAWLDKGDTQSVRVALSAQHAADLANILGAFETPEIARLLALLPLRLQAETFGYLDAELQLALADTLDRRALTAIVAAMSHDERADLFASLSEEQRALLLPGLAQAERDDMLKLAAYAEGTVGSVMTSDYATLPPHLTAAQAIEHLRTEAPDTETIYSAYVLNEERQLVGAVRLRDLILARPGQTVGDLMRSDPPHIHAGAPREEAVALVAKYDLLALPVINGGDKMVGIVTADDAMDVAAEEATIDFHRQASVGAVGASVLKAPLWMLYRARVFWLVLLVFGNIFSGAGIASFEEMLEANIALVFFLPLLIDSGGNSGSQAATLMVRSLALGDVTRADYARLIGREVVIAGLLGLTMALAVSLIGIVRGGPEVAMVVAASMVVIVLMGSLIGLSLPFILSRVGVDPATASAPLVTSIADAAGVLIYFGLAYYVFGFAA